MFHSLKLSLAAFVVLGLSVVRAPQATAAIVVSDYQNLGDNLLTVDTDTGLEWLHLSQTAGLSPIQAIAQYSSDGFRWANRSEVSSLLDAFGLPGTAVNVTTPTSTPTQLSNTQNFVNTLGETSRVEDFQLTPDTRILGQITSSGFFDDESLNNQQWFAQVSYGFSEPPFSGSPNIVATYISGVDVTRANPFAPQSVFLVRSDEATDIPTPALLPGLVGLGMTVLRKRKQSTQLAD